MIIQAPSESSDANQSSLCRQMWALNANAVTWADKLLSALTKLSAQIMQFLCCPPPQKKKKKKEKNPLF